MSELDNNNEVAHKLYPTKVYKIQPFDNLNIKLNSLEGSAISLTNGARRNTNALAQASSAQFYINGYIVNENGEINIPYLGFVKVVGKSLVEIEALLEKQLKEYLKFVSVSVKLLNFRITFLGEVKKPGVQYVYENKITFLQALSMAGGFTDYADNKTVKMVREEDGQSKTVFIDASDPNILTSEYFFLQPNDVLYVKPLKAKTFKINSNIVSVTFSAISLVLVIINLIRN